MPPADSRGEFALIRRFFHNLESGGGAVVLGVGDDGAVLRLADGEELVVSTDTQLEAVHFPAGAAGEQLAYRAVAAAASDLAAMGARPLGMTLALTLPAVDESWLQSLRGGLAAATQAFSLPLVGGDTTRGKLALTVTVLGAVPVGTALRRDGARPGDVLCVSGTLGDAAAGLALLQGQLSARKPVRTELLRRFWQPRPALELGTALRGRASAAIDVSDGLLADAGHIAAASAVRIDIDSAALPLSPLLLEAAGRERALQFALAGGDDYVLCFTLAAQGAIPDGCTVIATVSEGDGVSCDIDVSSTGFDHFRAEH